jgi:hypothetical protein
MEITTLGRLLNAINNATFVFIKTFHGGLTVRVSKDQAKEFVKSAYGTNINETAAKFHIDRFGTTDGYTVQIG